jgi:hypothetical protein
MRSVLLAVSLAACANATPAAVPPSEVAEPAPKVVEIAEAPDEPEPPAPPPGPEPDCSVRYQVERIDMSTSTCTVDIPKVGTEARLECRGGRANLHFEGKDYNGSISGNNLDLQLVSTYDFTDGCLWEASAKITGSPSAALRLDYTERTIRGTDCSSSCTATAILSVVQ